MARCSETRVESIFELSLDENQSVPLGDGGPLVGEHCSTLFDIERICAAQDAAQSACGAEGVQLGVQAVRKQHGAVSPHTVSRLCASSVLTNMSPEIRLVQEIEKYECLYNNNLLDHSRKDLIEEAWANVAAVSNLTISDCKEKWRNIRSSLLRSLKPSERNKRPYYLTPYLNFILPFMKPLNCLDCKEDYCMAKALKSSDSRYDDNDLLYESAVCCKRKKNDDVPSPKRKAEEPVEMVEDEVYTLTQDPPRTVAESMNYFLMSLLPEFETMTEDETRLFKIKVMILIDDIKYNFDKLKETIATTTESHRVQKRLINLLLRNLQNDYK